MNRKTIIAATTAAAALAAPAAAPAHVTLQPDEAPAGGFARMDVRVPNEDDTNATTKVVVQMPPGFACRVLRARPGLAREGDQAQARRADRRRSRRDADRRGRRA